MAFILTHECETCGHSIPLDLTYCGVENCLNRYADDNELEGHPYADYQAWQQAAPEAHAEVDYHEWAVAHRDLDRLQSEETPFPGDDEEIAILRAALFPKQAASTVNVPGSDPEGTVRYTEANEHPAYSHAQFRTWQQAGGQPVSLTYHEWAEAHCELDALQEGEAIDRHDQDNIDALRAQLLFETAPAA